MEGSAVQRTPLGNVFLTDRSNDRRVHGMSGGSPAFVRGERAATLIGRFSAGNKVLYQGKTLVVPQMLEIIPGFSP